jgi:hypothetical protein
VVEDVALQPSSNQPYAAAMNLNLSVFWTLVVLMVGVLVLAAVVMVIVLAAGGLEM